MWRAAWPSPLPPGRLSLPSAVGRVRTGLEAPLGGGYPAWDQAAACVISCECKTRWNPGSPEPQLPADIRTRLGTFMVMATCKNNSLKFRWLCLGLQISVWRAGRGRTWRTGTSAFMWGTEMFFEFGPNSRSDGPSITTFTNGDTLWKFVKWGQEHTSSIRLNSLFILRMQMVKDVI